MAPYGWRALPAIRHALAFATGIVAADAVPSTHPLLLAILAAALLSFGATRGTQGDLRRIISSLLSLILVAAAGLSIRTAQSERRWLPPAIEVQGAEAVGRIVESARGGKDVIIRCDSILLRSHVVRTRRSISVRLHDVSGTQLCTGYRIAVCGALRSPRPPRYPGDFDERTWFEQRGIAFALDARDVHIVKQLAEDAASRIVANVRDRLRDFAEQEVGGDEGEIVRALLLGERDGIDRPTRDAFARTGTIHVLAVSGLHLSLIAAGLAVVVSWLPDRRHRLVVFVALLGFYAVVAGAGPSIVRAWCMATAFMLGSVAGRQTSTLNLLGLAALVILVADPLELYAPGFQLSFSAVAGIALLYGRGRRWLLQIMPASLCRAPTTWVVSAFALTASAQLLTIPLLLYHFGSVPMLGLLLNLAVVPLTSLALGASLAGALLTWMEPFASWYGATAWCAARAAVAIVQAGAATPLASVGPWWIPWQAAVACGALMLVAAVARSARGMVLRLLLAAIVTWTAVKALWALDPLRLHGAAAAYILPSGRGGVIAVQCGSRIVCYTAQPDTNGGLERMLSALGRRSGASEYRSVVLARGATTLASDLIAVDSASWLLVDPPMLISVSRRRPLRLVRFGQDLLLQVSTRERPERALVFHYRDNWERVRWD